MTGFNKSTLLHAISSAMHVLHESRLYGSELWPKNGVFAGSFPPKNKAGNFKIDTICIKAMSSENRNWLHINLFTKTYARAYKMHRQLNLIFDYTVYDGLTFRDKINYLFATEMKNYYIGMFSIEFEL